MQIQFIHGGTFSWTASNGVVIYIQSDGNMSCNAVGDEATAAINEYFATH